MDKTKFKSVFESHQKQSKIWVVNNQPFLEESQANDYAKSHDDYSIVEILRADAYKSEAKQPPVANKPAKPAESKQPVVTVTPVVPEAPPAE